MCKQIYIGKVTPLSHRMLPAPRHSSEHPGRGGFEYLGDEKSSIMDEKSKPFIILKIKKKFFFL